MEVIGNLIKTSEHDIISACFSHNGNILAIGYSNSLIEIYKNKVLKYQVIYNNGPNSNYSISFLYFSQDDSLLLIKSSFEEITIFNMNTYETLITLSDVQSSKIHMSKDNNNILCIKNNGSIIIYNTSDNWNTYILNSKHLNTLSKVACISKDGSKIATYCEAGFIKIWNTETLEEITTLICNIHKRSVLCFLPIPEPAMW